ncbi:hypothetical protein [Flavihumibacter petaseus]|uniref:Uncharacterized protein n=1 Tax=Flavihumibacter petaseus NBRC 106054 TaxID=1220578 RepID=A0A0E9N402_9BACT|nr:hypothetical protein [Flavihumibacter petaseus]GAO44712.1 hypothetical protein FPE01S_03_07510 [Flavihumibacter petaseus NBRC 106054]
MSKFKKPNASGENPAISLAKQLAEQQAKELINFSFKYLNGDHEKFCYYPHEGNYFAELIARLKALSSITKQEFLSNRSSALRAHPIDWNGTTESCFGFPREEEIVDIPYQFSINSNEAGRVHGFFIYNTFYSVWLDKSHLLYS